MRSTPFFIVRHPLLHKATLRKDVIALYAITEQKIIWTMT